MSESISREDIRHWVHSFVWSGEYDADEILLLIEDDLGVDGEVDEGWLRDLIATEVAAKQEAERSWPEVTDYDRLERAFEALGRQGIIALHRAGFTQSDALEEVEEEYHEAGGEASDYRGHCFYTEQDQEGAVDGAGMYIGFGHLTGGDARGARVGRLVRAALELEGLAVEWDGTPGCRMFVKGFRWQRRGPR